MKGWRWMRWSRLLVTGMVLLQAGGCTTAQFVEFVQTVFLGISAAGAVAILQNI